MTDHYERIQQESEMNTINDGGPAFPVWELNGKDQPEMTGFGLSMRDYFAAKAMQGYFASPVASHRVDADDVAKYCYAMADAMLRAREASND
jgi:hypothetical protein